MRTYSASLVILDDVLLLVMVLQSICLQEKERRCSLSCQVPEDSVAETETSSPFVLFLEMKMSLKGSPLQSLMTRKMEVMHQT
jgi:hypothetical protein